MPVQFLSLQGTGGTAVPYDRRSAPQYLASIATNPQDTLRLKRYEEHWRFYQGLHWSFQREDGEPLVTANYCRTVVNKKASWLVGKGMSLKTPEALNEITKPVLDEVWEYNKEDIFLLAMAIMGGVTGDVFVMVTYTPPTTQQLKINPYTEGKIRLRLLGSHQVFPYWNPLNMEELISVRIITEVSDYAPIQPGDDRRSPMTLGTLGVNRKRRYIEDYYPDKIVSGWDGEERVERPNDLGEIPLIHISNEIFPGEYFGLSDLDGFVDIQREFNEKLTDLSDIVNYHAAPVTIMTGAKAKNLEKGHKSMWSGLPENAKVFNLQLAGDMGVAHKYLELVREIMFDLSNLPEGSLGRIQPISNTSASALQVAFQPLVEATERKRPNYEHGLEMINYFILRYDQLVNARKLPVDLCSSCGGRIAQITEKDVEGKETRRKQCFLVDPQTLEFMSPENVEINWKRKHSFGAETRMMKFSQVKKEYLTEGASAWDPAVKTDLEKKADEEHELARGQQEHAATTEHVATEQHKAEQPPAVPGDKPQPMTPVTNAAPLPAHLDPTPEVKPEQLLPHEVDIPEEPVTVNVVYRTWNTANGGSVETSKPMELRIVPSGCKRPRYLSPYTTQARLRTTLPRNKSEEMTLYHQYLQDAIVSRRWIRERLDEEDMDGAKMDKEIMDDVPYIMAMQGKPDVAQGEVSGAPAAPVAGNGSANGAPLPPGPGPGRGNLKAPGDGMAKPLKAPANAVPGSHV